MRIGIVTQPLHNNYGGLLQNYALQRVLRDSGHDPITLDWSPISIPWWKEKGYNLKIWVYRNILGNKAVPRPSYKLNQVENKIISRNNYKFIDKYISHTEKVNSSKGFSEILNREGVQTLIAGSDQCWRPNYAGGHIYDMFFRFAENKNINRIAYAASFGTDIWEFSIEQTEECRRLVNKFNLVTVREKSGVDLCRDNLKVNATHVLDPTMLLDRAVYEQIAHDLGSHKSIGNLFYYILDPSKEKIAMVDSIASARDMKPFTVMPICQAENRTKQNVKKEIEKCVFPGVEQWLRAFMEAEMVICDSFHGCVFSIIFNRPFWVIGNSKRGNARFDSLLKTFGLEDRLITIGENIDINKPIAWENVNDILEQKRAFSKDLLLNALK